MAKRKEEDLKNFTQAFEKHKNAIMHQAQVSKKKIEQISHISDLKEVIESYETLPRESSKSAEQKAIEHMRDILNLLEKDIQGGLEDTDREKMDIHKENWIKSIYVLREYIENKEV